jgi:Domain of unknown function (DUF4412)
VLQIWLALALLTPGLRYRFTVTNPAMRMVGSGQVAGDKIRVDYEMAGANGANPSLLPHHGYCLLTRGGQTVTIVDPDNRHYMTLDVAALGNLAGGMVSVEVTDRHVDTRNVGDGGTMQGYATVHFRRTDSHKTRTSVLGISAKTHVVNDTTDYWFAPALQDVMNPFVRPDDGMGEHGLALKMVMHGTHAMTMEVTDITKTDLAPSVFDVPTGYTETEADTGTESPGVLGDIKNEVKEDAKNSVQDKIRSAIHVP